MAKPRITAALAATLTAGAAHLALINVVIGPTLFVPALLGDDAAFARASAPGPIADEDSPAAPPVPRADAAAVEPSVADTAVSREPVEVRFDTGEVAIDDAGRRVLEKAAETAQQRPDVSLIVAGHTDRRGGLAYNERLSRRRALAAAAVLRDLGVPADRLVVQSFGHRHPRARGVDPASLARNRRVEVQFKER